MMMWKKPEGMKYTDMCIYIDENVSKLTNPGEYPRVEDTIYNYLWLLVKALAISKCMFENFEDYDGYAFYAAKRLFFALRKNQTNQGKIIKGKLIKPIKSCLNYTKALLYPMKVEYQNETYKQIISEEFVSKKFDSYAFSESLKEQVRFSGWSTDEFIGQLRYELVGCGKQLNSILEQSPFAPGSVEFKRLKISILLNCYYALKYKKKLNAEPTSIILWKLPKSMASYVRILLREFYTELKKTIMDCYSESLPEDITDAELKKILSTEEEDNKYED